MEAIVSDLALGNAAVTGLDAWSETLKNSGATAAGKTVGNIAKPIGALLSAAEIEAQYREYGAGAAAVTAAKEAVAHVTTGAAIAAGAARGVNLGSKAGAAIGALELR